MVNPIDKDSVYKKFFNSIPPFVRYFFAASLLLSLLTTLRIVPYYLMYLDFSSFIFKLQLWRPITALLFQG